MKKYMIGAGSDLGVDKDGARLGPEYLFNKVNHECEKDLFLQDGDYIKSKDKNDKRKNEEEIDKFNRKIYKSILEKKDCFTLLIGGDHSVAVASALASVKIHGEIGIIWIDAHTDYNTFETTITGNIHGLPLATIT